MACIIVDPLEGCGLNGGVTDAGIWPVQGVHPFQRSGINRVYN